MREVDGCSWEEIYAALPDRTLRAIQQLVIELARYCLPQLPLKRIVSFFHSLLKLRPKRVAAAGIQERGQVLGVDFRVESNELPPTSGQAAAQALCAYLSFGIRRDKCLKETLSFCRLIPTVFLFLHSSGDELITAHLCSRFVVDLLTDYDSSLHGLLLTGNLNVIEPSDIAFPSTYNLSDAYFALGGEEGIEKGFI
ncbi:uncharacterized protein PAC_17925 [Phialocephala subalpina]|uniref:Uncharacterized protein n=1 Tax=Phialocephala subalpina TaxID=576137 RepID=A0A1L7XSL4_9HELO|nr:uncharacterized protein PAC_17925 [Phialocephala subalpina]